MVQAPCQILLVDPDVNQAQSLKGQLEAFRPGGFELLHKTHLSAALTALDTSRADVVLLDLELPDSTGLGSIDVLRAKSPEVPIIVLTESGQEGLALEALQAGAQDFLSKVSGNGTLVARAIHYAIERKKAEVNLAYMAQYDQLCGVANRTLFGKALGQALARTCRSDRYLGLLHIDLDRFHQINETWGQEAGDSLLHQCAQRLVELVRQGDTVGRCGGNEFAVLLEGLRTTRDVARVAEKVTTLLKDPFQVRGHEVLVTASIGAALSDGRNADAAGLTKSADVAMRRAKELGGNGYRFFTPQMHQAVAGRLALEQDLRRGIEHGELLLHYQPQLDMETGRPMGAEALVRWRRSATGELISPADFIPLAEETGLINDLGAWVLDEGCRQARDWLDGGLPALRLSINLSVRQLESGHLVEQVARALKTYDLPPGHLELEVTEGLLMVDVRAAQLALHQIKDLGVRISVDDFGTGYSSMAYLKQLPLDTLKVDQTFVRELPNDSQDSAITAAIIALGHGLDLDIVAEGVETEAQLDFLREQRCDRAQGYLVSRPLPADDFAAWVREQWGH